MNTAQRIIQATREGCQKRFPDDPVNMETMEVRFHVDAVRCWYGSHKYIPADRLSRDIGAEPGSGVFGYYSFEDKSYVLLTCNHGLAYWDGTDNPAVVPPR